MFQPELVEPVLIYITRIFLLLLEIQAFLQLDQRFHGPLKRNFVDSHIFVFPSSSILIFLVFIRVWILIELVGIIFSTGFGFSLGVCAGLTFLVVLGTVRTIAGVVAFILLGIRVIRLDILLSDHFNHNSEHLTLSFLFDVFLFDVVDHF